MDMCYDGTLSTAFGLSSWLFTEGIKMYKVLYIGFLTFQLISVFCNLKSSKKDILEAHNSRKFNIIGIVCQIIAVIFIMLILKMQG